MCWRGWCRARGRRLYRLGRGNIAERCDADRVGCEKLHSRATDGAPEGSQWCCKNSHRRSPERDSGLPGNGVQEPVGELQAQGQGTMEDRLLEQPGIAVW